MKFSELILVLNCHTFDDFPIFHEGEEAEGLLAGWTALWHPLLVASAQSTPTWCRADSPPEQLQDRLLVIPSVSIKDLPGGFSQRTKEAGAFVIRKLTQRSEIVAAALAELDGGDAVLDPDLVADFFALGYCHLQTELLTRRMRYMSVLDESQFKDRCLEAATATIQGDAVTARERLGNCFSLLAEAKAHFYPVDAYLIDLTLVAGTTLGESLRAELRRDVPLNVMLSGATLEQMAREQPETLELLREKIHAGTVSLVGGDYGETDLPLRSAESILAELQRGLATYERYLERRPVVYGRRKFGLTPALPQILDKLGFVGVLHTALDDGRFPSADGGKTRWEGLDGTAIDAIPRVPFDASASGPFLQLSDKMGHAMDHDHVAALSFAHWPGTVADWYTDLRRMAKYAPALGRFITLNEFFQTTDTAGYMSRFEADEYRSPYLQQAVIRRTADPLSAVVREYEQEAVARQRTALGLLATVSQGREITAATDVAGATQAFVAALPRGKEGGEPGVLVANPASYTRRIPVDVERLSSLPDVQGPVLLAAEQHGRQQAVVEVPALGFAWVGAGRSGSARRGAETVIARDNILANDLMIVTFNPTTGSLHSLHDHKTRGNRFSQQLAVRIPKAGAAPGDAWTDPDKNAIYSVMGCDELKIVESTPLVGEILTRGRMMNLDGSTLGKYEQRARLWQGSRVLQLDIRLELNEELRSDPWNSYVAARFAWPDSTCEIYRSIHGASHRTDAKRIEAPLFVDIRAGGNRTTILSGGLPYHRRIGLRQLDTLLLVKGETAQSFRLGIGIDLPYAAPAAWDLFAAPTVQENMPAPAAPSGWLFHIDARNVIATHWEPLVENGKVVGFRARLQETDGRSGRVNLRTFRNVGTARLLNFQQAPRGELTVAGDRIQLDFANYEWQMLEARWQ